MEGRVGGDRFFSEGLQQDEGVDGHHQDVPEEVPRLPPLRQRRAYGTVQQAAGLQPDLLGLQSKEKAR